MTKKYLQVHWFSMILILVIVTLPLQLVAQEHHKQRKPILESLSPSTVSPGDTLTVNGRNFDIISSWTAVIELQSGEKFEMKISNVSPTRFTVSNVADIYQGLNVTEKINEHKQRIQQPKNFYIQMGNSVSNKLPISVRSPYPIIEWYNTSQAAPGETITVRGTNYDPQLKGYMANFAYLPKKLAHATPIPVPTVPSIQTGTFGLKVPDVFAGKSAAEQDAINKYDGHLFLVGPDGKVGNRLVFLIRKKDQATTGAQSKPAPTSCPGGQLLQGYTYVGQPGCATDNRVDHPSAHLRCDSSGYYCCENAQGAKTKCGYNKGTFVPDCVTYCRHVTGNCLVGPVIQDGVFYGCYRSNPR